MAALKAGSRLKSAVCDTQVMVIAAPAGEVALTCGGAAMVEITADAPGGDVAPDRSFDSRRYHGNLRSIALSTREEGTWAIPD